MGAFDHLITDQNMVGWFGPVTSTIDWCELNHTYSYYIAEFVNTLTNVPGIVFGLWGAWVTSQAGIPFRYALTYLGLALIGIGSFGFHASLRWEWQLMDELPMIYVVSWAAYLVFDTQPGFKFRGGKVGVLAVVAWDIFVTVSYVSLPNPVYHQVAFALIMSVSVLRAIWLLYQLPADRRAKIGRSLITGVSIFVLGFAIWNIDNLFCNHFRDAREWLESKGLEHLGHFTQGHGYWHLMTNYGAFLIFTACVQMCLSVKTNPYAYEYNSGDWFPIVRPVAGVETKAKLEDLPFEVTEKSLLVDSNGTAVAN